MMRLGCAIRCPRRAGGFSLVELMVTVAIIIIVTLVALPSMTGLVRDARISTQTDLLVSILNSARLEAVKQRKDMTVCPMANPNSDTACSISAGDWSNGFGVWDGSAIIQRVQAKSNVTLTTAATSVTFRGTLGSSTAAPTFTLCISGVKEREVDVALSGHVSKKMNSACS